MYFLAFLVSIIFTYFTDYLLKRDKRKLAICTACMSVLSVCILAGVRSFSIGTDVRTYMIPAFNNAIDYSWKSYIDSCSSANIEFGFALLTYIFSNIFKNLNIVLFLIQLIIVTPIYYILLKYRKEGNMTIGWAIFLLMFFNRSLNLIRQSMAISIVFLGLPYIKDKKLIKYCAIIVCASLFHFSAWFALTFYFLYYAVKSKNRIIYMFIIFAGLVSLNLILNIGIPKLVNYGLLSSKYLLYINTGSGFNFQYTDTIFRVIILFFAIVKFKSLKDVDNNYIIRFYIYMLFFDVIAYQLGTFSEYLYRLALYSSMFIIFGVQRIIKHAKNDKEIITVIVTLVTIFYHIYIYIITGSHETYPYISNYF